MAPGNSVPACFFFADAVDRTVSGLHICRACEEVAGSGSVAGAQRLYGLWRIYPATQEARDTLLMKGVTIDKLYIPIVGVNPMVAKGAHDSPVTKVIIGNIPLSVANDEIEKALKGIGVKMRSQLLYENYRDEEGKLTLFKSGRRFLYVDEPSKPLPSEFQVGSWRPSLYHPGQKKRADNVGPKELRDDQRSADRRADVSTNPPNPEVPGPVSSQAHRSRPLSRSPRDASRSGSRARTSRGKRPNSGEHTRSPSLKASKRGSSRSGGRTKIVDYYDLQDHEQQTPHNTRDVRQEDK